MTVTAAVVVIIAVRLTIIIAIMRASLSLTLFFCVIFKTTLKGLSRAVPGFTNSKLWAIHRFHSRRGSASTATSSRRSHGLDPPISEVPTGSRTRPRATRSSWTLGATARPGACGAPRADARFPRPHSP